MASLALEGVSRTYPGGVAALDRVSLHVSDEEFVVIVGPSGCGKSTTLRLIAGLEAADEGNIRIGERRVNDLAPKNRNVAMVFQNYALYPHMNVSRNMAFALELRSGGVLGKLRKQSNENQPALSKAEIKERVTEVARKLGIESLLDRKPGQLSGGEKQRVALGSGHRPPARPVSCSMNRSATSMLACVSTCGKNSNACTANYAPP